MAAVIEGDYVVAVAQSPGEEVPEVGTVLQAMQEQKGRKLWFAPVQIMQPQAVRINES